MTSNSDIISFSTSEFTYKHSVSKNVNDKIYSTHIHSGIEIIYLIDGSITYGFEGKEICVNSGDILITPPFIYHYIKFGDKSKYERINLLIYPENYGIKVNLNEVKIINDKKNVIYPILKSFDYYYHVSSQNERNNIFGIKIQELIFNMQKSLSNAKSLKTNQTDNTLYNILKYINKNIHKHITVEDISENCFISQGHVHHLFKSQLKTSPKNYIIMKKLSLAQNMLLSGNQPTKVSFSLGFDDYSVFYRNYVKYYKKKPIEDYNKRTH